MILEFSCKYHESKMKNAWKWTLLRRDVKNELVTDS